MNCTAIWPRRGIAGESLPRVTAPGRPAEAQVDPPEQVVDFGVLYARNCSGCHGADGTGGAAIGLGDPVYLAIADDATIRRVTADGVPGTAMPAFAQSAGGMLTDEQIDVLVRGIRTRWAKPDALRRRECLRLMQRRRPGDPKRGADVYRDVLLVVSRRRRPRRQRASSIVDGSYLALVSDQNLRTTVIAGQAANWALRTGAATYPASRCRQRMSPMSSPGSPRSGTQFPGQPYSTALHAKEEFDDVRRTDFPDAGCW